MSSLVRRIEKAMMKRAGYTRERWIIVRKPNGEPDIRNVRRGGEITDPDDNPIGRKWPVRIPARAMPAHKADRANRFRVVPKALRRSKRTKAWFAARAEASK